MLADQPDDAYVVGLEPGVGTDVATQNAGSVKHELDFGRIGTTVAGPFSEQAIEALERNPNVRHVERESTYRAFEQTPPWGIDRVDADVLHAEGETGGGADIAILDTGIDSDHYDLQANLGEGTAGNVLDSASSSVSGSSASGSHSVRSKQNASEVRLTVVDDAGNSTAETQSVWDGGPTPACSHASIFTRRRGQIPRVLTTVAERPAIARHTAPRTTFVPSVRHGRPVRPDSLVDDSQPRRRFVGPPVGPLHVDPLPRVTRVARAE